MNKTIEKADLVTARQRVLDVEVELHARSQEDLSGKTNEEMVDLEVEIAKLSYAQASATHNYQALVHRYCEQQGDAGCIGDE